MSDTLGGQENRLVGEGKHGGSGKGESQQEVQRKEDLISRQKTENLLDV